jgi:hypothetical protein
LDGLDDYKNDIGEHVFGPTARECNVYETVRRRCMKPPLPWAT